jgi:hypothetical protein
MNMLDLQNLQGMLSFEPTPEERQRAMTQGLLMGGLGILGANAQNPRGAGPMAPLAGAMPGLIGYNRLLEDAPKHRLQNIQGLLQLQKFKRDMDSEDMLKQFVMGQGGPQGAQGALSAEMASGGQPGPTNAAAARIPQQQAGQVPNFGMLAAGRVPPEIVKLLMEDWKLRHPELKFEGGMARDPRTGAIMPGVPSTPQTNQQGFSTTPRLNPQTGQIEIGITPGSIDAFGTQQDVQHRSAARYGPPVTMQLPGGHAQTMRQDQASDFLGGGQQAQAVPQAPQRAPQAFPRVAPQVQNGRDQERLTILQRERAEQQANGRVDPALDREIAQTERRVGGRRAADLPGNGRAAGTWDKQREYRCWPRVLAAPYERG